MVNNLVSPLPLAQILGGGDVLGPAESMSHPAPTYSPLPPSSPPSEITCSPQYPKILHNPHPSWLSSDPKLWNQFDDGRPPSQVSPTSMTSSSSDPFGFVALERKLKVERRAAVPSPLKRHHQDDESDEELGQVLIADTSSPRLVRRLKRPSYQGDSLFPPTIFEHPNYATPPTPHKDKKKRPRLSHEGDRVFSPCSSSMPSTPSPSKPPVQKQAEREDTLKNNSKGNQEVEDVLGRTRNRTARGIVKSKPSTTSKVTIKTPLELGKSLDDDAETEEEQADLKRAKVAIKSKKIPKKPRSTGTKKSKKEENDEDFEEVCSLHWFWLVILSSLLSIRNGSENDKNALHISSGWKDIKSRRKTSASSEQLFKVNFEDAFSRLPKQILISLSWCVISMYICTPPVLKLDTNKLEHSKSRDRLPMKPWHISNEIFPIITGTHDPLAPRSARCVFMNFNENDKGGIFNPKITSHVVTSCQTDCVGFLLAVDLKQDPWG
jgi:hypothetical protein